MLIFAALAVITGLLMFLLENVNKNRLRQEANSWKDQLEIVEIHTIEEYLKFSQEVGEGNSYKNCVVRLCEDLDFSETEDISPIGRAEAPFEGIFDGDGHKITGLKIKNPGGSSGMFAFLQGTVKNLQMEACEFSGEICGAIAARSYEGAVLNCRIEAEVTGELSAAVIGELHGNVLNCVTSSEAVAGKIKKGIVENCYVAGCEDVEALNENLSYISGYYADTEFYLWEKEEEASLSKKKADLLESLTARFELNGHEYKLQGYYSCNDRTWCFALPALRKDIKMTIDAFTSDGGFERLERKQGEETIEFLWKEIVYPIEFLCADNIDTLYVTLQKQKKLQDVHQDKLEEIPGVLTIMDADGNISNEVIKGFYGHGNDSWAAEKKSYNLKMSTPIDLLGMGENEDYSLLACYRDNSLMCYCTTTELIRELGFPYPPQFRLVNLYVAGEYAGIYFLAEKVELDQNRIDITNVYEETKAVNHNYLGGFEQKIWKDENSLAERHFYEVENDPEDLTGGYLLEADIVDYGPDESRFVSERGIPITMKRARYSSEAQVNYIADYWQEFEDALFSADGKNDQGKHYTEYIDAESFAMQWLLYELVQEGSMSSSIYFYKESDISGDGLLHACFPWDMEHSYIMSDKLGDLWNTTEKAGTLYGYWNVFYSHEDFREQLRKVWTEKFVPAIDVMIAEESIETQSGMRNLRWYEERIEEMDHLENSRWRKMYPLNRCQTNREFLSVRKAVLSTRLFE